MKLNISYPTVRIVYDRRKKASSVTLGSIDLEISYNGKRKWISTGVRILPKQWSPELLVVRHADCANLRMTVETVKKRVLDFIQLCMIKGEEFSFQLLTEAMNRSKFDGNLIDFIRMRIEERTDLGPGTKRNHNKLVNALEEFRKIRLFSDVTRQNILDFDEWLHGRDYKQSTVHSYHKFLKVYIHQAMMRDLILKDPYDGIKIKEGKAAVRKYLTVEEMWRIRDCTCLTPSMQRVRDLFMFQFYTGLAYVDLRSFDFSKVMERDGRFVLVDVRRKSGETFYIVIVDAAMEILRRYDMKLPLMTNEQYNMRLKVLADAAGIDKRITSHMARHSFATYALNEGIPLEVVSRMLGHSNTNTTQIYAKVMNKTIETAFDKLNR